MKTFSKTHRLNIVFYVFIMYTCHDIVYLPKMLRVILSVEGIFYRNDYVTGKTEFKIRS